MGNLEQACEVCHEFESTEAGCCLQGAKCVCFIGYHSELRQETLESLELAAPRGRTIRVSRKNPTCLS